MTPQGRVFNQRIAAEFSLYEKIALICGRYEGVDERIRAHLVTDEISIGDYVLTGGELPALLLIDAIARFIPDVLGDPDGATGRLCTLRVCLNIRITRVRPNFAAGLCPTFCSPAITPRSINGAANNPCAARLHAGLIYWTKQH